MSSLGPWADNTAEGKADSTELVGSVYAATRKITRAPQAFCAAQCSAVPAAEILVEILPGMPTGMPTGILAQMLAASPVGMLALAGPWQDRGAGLRGGNRVKGVSA